MVLLTHNTCPSEAPPSLTTRSYAPTGSQAPGADLDLVSLSRACAGIGGMCPYLVFSPRPPPTLAGPDHAQLDHGKPGAPGMQQRR
jgi:hypothetical protein